jgi:hypothetical protein
MKNHYKLALSALTGLILIFAFMGCNGSASDDGLTLDPGGGGALPGTNDGVVADTNFYIAVDSAINKTAHVHTSGDFTTSCAISKNETTSKDLTCIIDMPEGDLNFNGINFKIHIPADTCTYLQRNTYWFYNYETGIGPTSITLHKTQTTNASGDVSVSPTHDCTVNGVFDANCDNQTEITTLVDSQKSESKCVYDHTDDDGPNCCFGSITKTLNTFDTGTSITTIQTGSPTTWGGSIQSCIGGPGRVEWPFVDDDGFPISVLESTEAGADLTYKVSSPFTLLKSTFNNMHVANFYTTAMHSHDGYSSLVTSSKPYFIQPIDDRNGSDMNAGSATSSSLPSGNDSYEFFCLDRGYEIKHRIRVYVRDWDTYPDYVTYITTAGATSVPDRPADFAPVTNCEGLPGPCDDSYDLDDYINIYLSGSPYNTASPLLRDNNFPKLEYK